MNVCDCFTLPLISILILLFIIVRSYRSNYYDPDNGICKETDQNYSASVGTQEYCIRDLDPLDSIIISTPENNLPQLVKHSNIIMFNILYNFAGVAVRN